MRKNQISGIIHNLLHLSGWQHPLGYISLPRKFEINLLNGEIKYLKGYSEDDDLGKFYKEKQEWFVERVKKFGGKLSDFKEAKIKVIGAKEKVIINYKDKSFEGEEVI
ncbi:MAG: hypothetical protein KJ879_00515 [Nanoarchaeota archaeon]|nr:hypothetical protein [Nanoarchaeota archaeon]